MRPRTHHLLAVALLATAGCASAIDSKYLLAGYDGGHDDAVKRITVAAWATDPKLAELAAAIGTDFVKLRKDYLVYPPVVLGRDIGEACAERDGVLVIRVLAAHEADDEASARLSAELYRCSNGQLVWRAEGADEEEMDDEDLTHLTEVYVRNMGPLARRYAAVLFVLTQELMQSLPNPTLNDDEVLERIELGWRGPRSEYVAAVP